MVNHFDIFEEARQPFASLKDAVDYLNAAKARYKVANLSYWYLGHGREADDHVTWISTYDERYMALYMRDIKPSSDPIFDIGFTRQMPLDWAEFHGFNDTTESMEEMAGEYGIAPLGISFPIIDANAGQAMFSVNCTCDRQEWPQMRADLLNVFHLFAHFFHLRVKDLMLAQHVQTRTDLSPRERDVLRWAAEGKTAWETARVLGVSHSAARLYMSNAMMKLGATSKTQAVALAFRNRIIN